MSAAKKGGQRGLAAFTTAKVSEPPQLAAKQARGKGDTVALTVRLPKDAWKRLSVLAMDEGVSLQSLAVYGFNLVLQKKGLDPLDV